MQMLPGNVIGNTFATYMMGQSKKLINQIPAELSVVDEIRPPYPGQQGFLSLTIANKQGLSASDESAYNVVVAGPTGAGKSSIINKLFNQTVTKEASCAHSVRREIAVFEGTGLVYNTYRRGQSTTVNIIDTIGFCDSFMEPEEVVALIKHWLKVQDVVIDKVVFVLAGRIETVHAQNIKDLMKWLNFGDHPTRFLFVYNKADLVPDESTMQTNIAEMAESLETGFQQLAFHGGLAVDLNMTLGISPDATYEESQNILQSLALPLFANVDNSRIRVNLNRACRIL
eukprot:gb/GFBE01042145.1/.p1 GENE.gb/GFBE01042145.1/~~gb/GFBE01042145.1/.p1  ORF type:complete len:285 (+),score=73.76 gb/GFBE01042145.1/:1-855(+)